MVGISMCQSDPMVVPFGGTEPYFELTRLHLVRHRMTTVLHLIWQQQCKRGESARCESETFIYSRYMGSRRTR